MFLIQNLLEYYDELCPVTASQKAYFANLAKHFAMPVKFLRVKCGTGQFESMLARQGHDVTGIESIKELLHSANLRKRNQLMSIRFFQMNFREMTKFLGKGFYNIISCLDSRIIFLGGKEDIRGFFRDCHELLAPEGYFILELLNFDKFTLTPLCKLPTRESVRMRFFSELWTDSKGRHSMTQHVETGNGKLLPVVKDEPAYALRIEEIREFAQAAGFSSVTCYATFAGEPFTGEEDRVVVEMR